MKYVRKFYGKSSRRGAAILISLLVFFLAGLSGTVALTMAASNAGRYTHEKDDQQAYLSVVSAANLILDRLAGLSVIYRATEPEFSPNEVDDVNDNKVVIDYVYDKGRTPDLFLADDGFKRNLLLATLPNAPAWNPVVFSLSDSANREMGKVFVSVDKSGNTFSFALYHLSGSARNYQMTLEVGSIFTETGYTQDSEDKVYKRHMTFATESAKFIVKKNVSTGDTGE